MEAESLYREKRERLVDVAAKTVEDLAKAVERQDLTVISALLRRGHQLDLPSEQGQVLKHHD